MQDKTAPQGNISEEYYQISHAILSSFPKYRPPLDLFRLKEETGQLLPFISKGQRLSNEQVEEVQVLCDQGDLFVSRADHPIYSQHIVKQLDLVLVDRNLKPGEVADICLQALGIKLADFIDQPVKPVFELLYTDVQVMSEYIWQDKHNLKLFMRRLHTGDYSLISQSLNTMVLGWWLLFSSQGEDLRRKEFDNAGLAFLLHDVGMSKVPSFILGKTTPLKPEEKDKIPPHPLTGMKNLQKLDLVHDEIKHIVLEHHERLDGSGYPQKMKGEQISRLGRLAAVADSCAAMIQNRPYAEAKTGADAARELNNDSARYDRRFSMPLLTAFLTNTFV
jgi:hypothetical protein